MNNFIENFGPFLDKLRSSRNMSRDDFTDGIMSVRQYQRYVSGEASINNEKLFKLIDRLNMGFVEVYNLYQKKENEDNERLSRVYFLINANSYVKAEQLLQKIDKTTLGDSSRIMLHSFCEIFLLAETKRIPVDVAVKNIKELINYPDCLNNKVLSLVELTSLLFLSKKLISQEKDKRIVIFLYEKIKEDNIAANNLLQRYMPSIYATVSSALGSINEYEKSIFVAKKGISYCIKHDILNSLSHLYLYLAFSLHETNKTQDAIDAAKKLLSLLSVEDKEEKTKQFTASLENCFKMKVSEIYKN